VTPKRSSGDGIPRDESLAGQAGGRADADAGLFYAVAARGGSAHGAGQSPGSVEVRPETTGPWPLGVTLGELFDRRIILALKQRHIEDPVKRAQVVAEIAALPRPPIHVEHVYRVGCLIAELTAINSWLWDIEDFLRTCEALQRFDALFIQAARDVYRYNDRRAACKREIDRTVGCLTGEVKQHVHYEAHYAAPPTPS